MFLKKIKINGFKSFAKPIIIEFNTALTAIVGPNGSGKSNIVDAIRWVLGEQSAKILRGNKMADIIFSGSQVHKPLNKASVYLYLDNSDGTLQVDSNEVVIGRRVNNNGESDYLLNDEVCRLKDIKKILLDTGLGKDLYSIVGQGKIDSIINSKPDKLRGLFEEAAGISRHKVRRQEAEKRLEKTARNLQRINDLIKELKNQLNPLKKEADRAGKYEKLSKKLKELEVSLLLDKWEKNNAEVSSVNINKEFLEEKLEYTQKNLENIENDLSEENKVINSKMELLSEKREELFKIKSKRDELKNKLTLYKERKINLAGDIEDINKWSKDIESKKDKIKVNINQLEIKINNSENKKQSIKNRINVENDKQEELIKNLKINKEKLSVLQADMLNEKGNIKNEIDKLKEKIYYKEEKKKELLAEKEKLTNQLHNRKKDSDKVKEELKSITEFKQNIEEKNKMLKKNRQKKVSIFNSKKDELENISDKLKDNKSRLNVLKEMDDSFDGYYYGVKNVLKSADKFPGFRGVFAKLIKVESKYIEAVETVLAGRMQNIVVNSDKTAASIIKYLKNNKLGYATFLPVNIIKGKKIVFSDKSIKNINGFIGIASDFVNYDNYLREIVEYLLGSTIIASNIDNASVITRRINSRYKIVTLDGEVIRTGGAMTGGSKNKKSKSLISRSREKNDLKAEINSLNIEYNNENKKLQAIDREINILKNKIKKNREKSHQLELDERSINFDLTGINDKINKLTERIAKNDDEIKLIDTELSSLNSKKEKLDSKIEATKSDNGKNKKILNNYKNNINEIEKNKERTAEKITKLKIELATEKQKIESYSLEKKKMKNELKEYSIKYKQKKKEIENKKNKLLDVKQKISSVKEDLSRYKEIIENIDNNILDIKSSIEKKEKLRDEYSEQQQKINNEIEDIKEQLHKIELKLNRLENKCSISRERLQEAYQIDPEQNNFTERIKITNQSRARSKINEFKNTINSMGIVNSGAKKEYNKLKERVDYLSNQKQDLIQARKSINKIIDEIEKTMGNLFYQSYKNVREQFENIFADLFSGGKAELNLSNPDDLLNTGVEISAQPPGKKLKKLSLMSGGERALTAIALVFAFLNVNPSPFYILDEIDAPLDDANVIRFGKFITEYSNFAQFIIITHRKHMMTRAATIYGVTMQEMGVSKIVSLNIKNNGGSKIYGYI